MLSKSAEAQVALEAKALLVDSIVVSQVFNGFMVALSVLELYKNIIAVLYHKLHSKMKMNNVFLS